jgi:hypothetical protein
VTPLGSETLSRVIERRSDGTLQIHVFVGGSFIEYQTADHQPTMLHLIPGRTYTLPGERGAIVEGSIQLYRMPAGRRSAWSATLLDWFDHLISRIRVPWSRDDRDQG